MAEENTENKNKMTSRKFLVWITWLILMIGIIVLSFVRKTGDDLISSALQDFFFVSITYLGVNGVQKVGFAVSDALSSGTAKEDDNAE